MPGGQVNHAISILHRIVVTTGGESTSCQFRPHYLPAARHLLLILKIQLHYMIFVCLRVFLSELRPSSDVKEPPIEVLRVLETRRYFVQELMLYNQHPFPQQLVDKTDSR